MTGGKTGPDAGRDVDTQGSWDRRKADVWEVGTFFVLRWTALVETGGGNIPRAKIECIFLKSWHRHGLSRAVDIHFFNFL